MRQAIRTNDASVGSGPYSQGIVAGSMLFISGQGPLAGDGSIVSGDIEAETRLTMDNIKAIVEAGGCTMDHIVKVNVFLASLTDFDRFNAVYQSYFESPFPARTCVEAGLDGIKVEIDAMAYKPE